MKRHRDAHLQCMLPSESSQSEKAACRVTLSLKLMVMKSQGKDGWKGDRGKGSGIRPLILSWWNTGRDLSERTCNQLWTQALRHSSSRFMLSFGHPGTSSQGLGCAGPSQLLNQLIALPSFNILPTSFVSCWDFLAVIWAFLRVHWTSWICRLMLFTSFGKCLAIVPQIFRLS